MEKRFYFKKLTALSLAFAISATATGIPAQTASATGINETQNTEDTSSLAEEATTGNDGNQKTTDGTGNEGSQTVSKVVMRAGKENIFQAAGAKGKVKWSVSNQKILKIVAKKNKECTVRALKDGKASVTAVMENGTATYKVTVKSGKAFVKAWCRQWADTYITDGMSDKDRLISASAYITSARFTYGETSEPEDVITEGAGTCVSGGKLLVYMCEAMGYEAKLRFAAKDDMSRYPQGVYFASQHYNVEAKVKGRKYYMDATPGAGFVYLSTSKKPLFYGIVLGVLLVPVEL